MTIVVSDLEYAPPGADSLFFDVSFGVGPGERAALVGPNGVGKTTILRILAGELSALDGEYQVAGTVLTMAQDAGMAHPDDTLRDLLLAVRRRRCAVPAGHWWRPRRRWRRGPTTAPATPPR